MKFRLASFLVFGLCFSTTSSSQERPRLPYYSWGACPFECCTYRDWKAEEAVTAFAQRDLKGPTAFEIRKGEWIRGIDGVVITYRAGLSKMVKPMEIGYEKAGGKPMLALRAGEVVYPLHYEGEGSYLFWYKGKVYSDGVSSNKPDTNAPLPDVSIQTVVVPKYVWWAKIRNKQGVVGWTNQTRRFSNVDACG